jgi:hypothetical protein
MRFLPMENGADRLVPHVGSDVGQRSCDTVVPPCRIVPSESDNQFFLLTTDSRPTGTRPALGPVKLRGDQSAVPAQNGVRFCVTGDFSSALRPTRLLISARVARQRERTEDSVLSGKVFVLKQQLLIYEPGDVRQ